MLNNDALLDKFIEHQSRAIRWQLAFAVVLLVLGLLLLLVAHLLPDQAETSPLNKTLLSASGALISTLCAFPIKDLLARREKADLLRFLKAHLVAVGSIDPAPQGERDRVEAALWTTLTKALER